MKNKLYLTKILVITLILFSAILCLHYIFAEDYFVENVENTQAVKNTDSYTNNYEISYPTIKADINAILNDKNLLKTNFGIAVYSTKLNKFIYQNNHKKKLIPASNTKLFTTFTSYANLGENYNIPTSVCYDGKISNGTLIGNLYLVGGGDPLLNINDIELLADAVKEIGITKITGNIYGDCSYFDEITDRYKYSNDADEVQAVAPITALAIEKNLVTIIITSGSIAGKPLTVQYKPASSAFTTTVSATVAANTTTNSTYELDNLDDYNSYLANNSNIFNNSNNSSNSNNNSSNNYDVYFGDEAVFAAATKKSNKSNIKNNTKKNSKTRTNSSPISIKPTVSADGKQHFTVTGSLPKNRTYTYQYHIKNPAAVAASSLKDRLEAGGVIISGSVETKYLQSTDLANKISIFTFTRNINDVITPVNKFSDNYLAETLFKLNGAVAGYDKNCAKSAVISTNNTIKKFEICTDGIVLNDGSGLSRRNLVTAEALIDILRFSAKMPFYKHLEASLSIAGVDGTLAKRMKNTLAMDNLRAKTGTLRNVSSLAGYVNTKSGDTLIFSFIFNGANVGIYKNIENKLGDLLATY